MIANGALNLSNSSQPPYFPDAMIDYSCNAGYASSNLFANFNLCLRSSSSNSSFWVQSTSDLAEICQPSKCSIRGYTVRM